MSERDYLIAKARRMSRGEATHSGSLGVVDDKTWDKATKYGVRRATTSSGLSGTVIGGAIGGAASGSIKGAAIGAGVGGAGFTGLGYYAADKRTRNPEVRRRLEQTLVDRAGGSFRRAGMKVKQRVGDR